MGRSAPNVIKFA